MDRDSINAIAMAIAVVAVIVGFGVYFNSPGLNKVSSSQQQLEKVVSARYYNQWYNQNNKA